MTTDTDPNDSRLRLRALLNAQFAVVVAVLLVCTALGAGLVYTTHVDPAMESEERVVSSWSIESQYDHSAEVTESNAVFPVGTNLTDRNTYFTRIAPELDVDVRTSYAANEASGVDVRTESVLVVRNADENTVYWEQTESLASTEATDVAPGDPVNASFTLNASSVADRISTIEDQLGAAPGETEAFVATTVVLSGTINGQSVEHTRTLDLGVTPDGDTYAVDDPGTQSDTIERTETVPVEPTYGPLRTVGGPLLLLVGLAGTAPLVYARRDGRFELTDAERAYLEFRDDRSEFDEWITRVRLPESAFDRPEARADSLRDLVNFAIDNDVAVVEDPRTGRFNAVAGDYLYTFVPPTPTGLDSDRDGALSESSPAGSGGIDGDSDADGDATVATADADDGSDDLFATNGSERTETDAGGAGDAGDDDGSESDAGDADERA